MAAEFETRERKQPKAPHSKAPKKAPKPPKTAPKAPKAPSKGQNKPASSPFAQPDTVGSASPVVAEGSAIGAMKPTIPTQFVLHESWALSPMGRGAGDYATYGEAFSDARMDAVLDASVKGATEGVGDGLFGVAVGLGEGLAFKALNDFAPKLVPGVGGLLSIADGAIGMYEFDWGGFSRRTMALYDAESWDDDPWGQLANVLRVVGDYMALVGNMCNIVGGVVELVGIGTLAPHAVIAGKAVSLLGDGLGAAEVAMAAFASSSRALSILTSDADARQIDAALKALEDETSSMVAGIIGITADKIKGAIGDGDKKDTDVDTDAPAKDGEDPLTGGSKTFKSLLEAAAGEQSPAGAALPLLPRLNRWSDAHARVQKEQELRDTLTGMAQIALSPALSPFYAEWIEAPSFDDLPGAPHDPAGMDAESKEIARLTGEERQHARLMPKLKAAREEAINLSIKARNTASSGQNMTQQLDSAGSELDQKTQAQQKATAELSALQGHAAKAQNGERDTAKAIEELRQFVELVGAVPAELMPAPLARAVKQARAALAVKANGEDRQTHQDKGVGRLKEAEASAQSANVSLETHRSKAKGWIETGETAEKALEQERTALEAAQLDCLERVLKAQKRAQEIKAGLEKKHQAMAAWSATHEATARDNDALADHILDGAPPVQSASALDPRHIEARDAALADITDCTSFCQACLNQGATMAFDDPAEGLSGQLQADVRSATDASTAILGRDAVNLAQEGIEDLKVLRTALSRITPDNALEIINEAFDTTGRLRRRLELSRDTPDVEPAPECREPEPIPKIDPLTVFFRFDRPSGEGGTPMEAGQKSRLERFGKALAKGQGGAVQATGHASVEGSKRYNQGLARRRVMFVEQSLKAMGSTASVASNAVGEGREEAPDTASHEHANSPEYAHRRWRKVDLQVTVQPTPKTESSEN